MKISPLYLLALLALLASLAMAPAVSAAVVYWDSNGVNPGAGVAPTGTWGSSTFWSTDANGESATVGWTASDTAVFSAGTDATSAYTVTVSGTQTVGGMNIEEGTVSIATGTVALGTSAVVISAGAVLSTDSSLRITSVTGGSTVTLNGGTLRSTNTGNAGTFFDPDSEIILGAAGGTFSYTGNVLNIVQTGTKITGPGSLTKVGAGVLAIASTPGLNTYAGPTIVRDGELRMRNANNPLPTTTALTVYDPAIFNLNGISQQVSALSGDGKVGTGNATLTVGDATDTTFSGTIDNINNVVNQGSAGVTTGNGKLTKVGNGKLTLTGANTYSGAFTLSAGTVTVAAGGMLCGTALPPAAASIATVTVNAGTLNLDNAAQTIGALAGTGGIINLASGHVLTTDPNTSTAYAGTIAGGGGLTKLNVFAGATMRTLTLTGPNTYDGPTVISGGNLAVGSPTALGGTLAGGGTQVQEGAELLFTGATVNFTVNEAIAIAGFGNSDNGAIAVTAGASPTLSGPVTLSEDATVTVSGTSTVTFTNANSFTASANDNLTLQGGSGAGGGGTIAGAIALGSGGLTKLQGGQWTLAGNNTYTGPTSVGGGILNVTGSLANTTVSVQGGGTLAGTGTLAGPTSVQSTGTLAPGAGGSGIGTLTINNTLELLGTAHFQLNKAGVVLTNDRLQGISTVTYGGILQVTATGNALSLGDTFQLFNATNRLGSFTSFILPALGVGLAWDTSALTTTGSISVGTTSAYAVWAAGLLTSGVNDGKTQDPDGDGMNNLGEFAFNGNPLSGSLSGKVVTVLTTVDSASHLVLTLPVRTGAVFAGATSQISALLDGISYRIEGSTDLTTWNQVLSEVTGPSAATLQSGLPTLDAGWTYRTFKTPTVGQPRLFLRAWVTDTP